MKEEYTLTFIRNKIPRVKFVDNNQMQLLCHEMLTISIRIRFLTNTLNLNDSCLPFELLHQTDIVVISWN